MEKQIDELKAQTETLKRQQNQLSLEQRKIAINKSTIDVAIAQFGQLDDYYVLDQLTVHFGNGKVTINPQYKTMLLKLANKAKTIEAYNIQVIRYASENSRVVLNQQLSEDRVRRVANFLIEQGHIPLPTLLASAAMGESRQVGDDKTAEGQARNRRVVVRVLQNKRIAGLQSTP